MTPVLIAHRGEPLSWPENSLAGCTAALEAGARYLETDVQITVDGIPVLSHDASLLKLTGHDLEIATTDYRTLSSLSAGYPERFGERFSDLRIAPLEAFTRLLQQWPDVLAFVEIKSAAIKAYGATRATDIILEVLGGVLSQCHIISFDTAPLAAARRRAGLPVGWVLPAWSPEQRARAAELEPEYLFCNRKRLPPINEPLWPGPWQWVGYTVNDPDEVPGFAERGFAMLETDCISRLLAGPRPAHAAHD
ncbi:MAG: glycerophosphodiester phosphodiesterase family protein [Gammaproteobacteria bacterium]|jgi:glycerophosphoryl diester phosphodiesterase